MGRSRQSVGIAGECVAVELLSRCGFTVVERNFRCRQGELDIIARHGETLVFVEVRRRRRGDHGSGIQSVTPQKAARVGRVAAVYLAQREPKAAGCRFDVVGITGDHVQLIPDAFRL